MQNLTNQQVLSQRRYFAISTTMGGNGPFVAQHIDPMRPPRGGHERQVIHERKAWLFTAEEADAILRVRTRWAVLQTVEIKSDATRGH